MRDELRATVAAAFLRNDLDVDGRIDRFEFQAVVSELSPSAADRASELFEVIDRDDDGEITFDEFVDWFAGI